MGINMNQIAWWDCNHPWVDGDIRCRNCDAVERINALAEIKSEPIRLYPGLHLYHIAPLLAARMAYIECADIIMEAENDFF